MMRATAILAAIFLFVAQLPLGLTSPSTVPAFLWSPQQDGMKEAVNYQTLTPKDLAKSVMSEGGWSNLLCSGEETQQPVDIAVLFVGREGKEHRRDKREQLCATKKAQIIHISSNNEDRGCRPCSLIPSFSVDFPSFLSKLLMHSDCGQNQNT